MDREKEINQRKKSIIKFTKRIYEFTKQITEAASSIDVFNKNIEMNRERISKLKKDRTGPTGEIIELEFDRGTLTDWRL